jgi:hypothetical protein
MTADLPVAAAGLERAIDAAARLGLDTSRAMAARATIEERAGYPGDLYVLALAGGTGVGKSSLLNALAGEVVSPAGIRRPTTSEPVAWVPAARRAEAAPLLEWLGGARVHERAGTDEAAAVAATAILDLPDLDSIEPSHAARVDLVLPRVDAVLWVTDPEKYDDAVLHDAYLRRWMPRLARQAIVVNKVDRVGSDGAERIRDDLLARLAAAGLPTVPVLLTSAAGDVGPLADWLVAGAEAKEVVSARLASGARAATRQLAVAAGVDGGSVPGPLVAPERRAAAEAAATRGILAVVDLPGLRRQAMEATRLAARPRGGGPLGVVRALASRGTGEAERRADPEGYLRRWRERGSLRRAVAPIRDLVVEALPSVPPDARRDLAALADAGALEGRFAEVTDRAVAGPAGTFTPPTSAAWPLLGAGQLVATAALVIGTAWLVTLFAAGGAVPTPTLEVPPIGPVPVPTLLIVGGLGGWFLLGRALSWHAGRLGARWADRLGARIAEDVRTVVRGAVGAPLAERDAARRALWEAATEAAPPAAGPPRAAADRVATA